MGGADDERGAPLVDNGDRLTVSAPSIDPARREQLRAEAAERLKHADDEMLDYCRRDELAREAELCASLWHSVALAADRGDVHTFLLHCKQIATVTREAFKIAREIGSSEVNDDQR